MQIDGLSRPLLEELLAAGRMPVMDGLLRAGALTLGSWVPQLPPCTPASQAGILHGRNEGIPGFRWYEKATGRLMVANRPRDAAQLAARVSNGRGLLAVNGSSIGNLLTGDAPSSHLTLATIEGDASGHDRSARWGAYPRDPLLYLRIAGLMLLDLGQEVLSVLRDRKSGGRRRVAPGWRYAVERALSTIPLRMLSTSLVAREMRRARDVIYVDFTGHDEVAHGRGPRSAEARTAAASIDRSIGIILREGRRAQRPYRLVILSDHGQSWGATFTQRYGEPLEHFVASLMGPGTTYHGASLPTEYADSPVRLARHVAGAGRLTGRAVAAVESRRRYRSRVGETDRDAAGVNGPGGAATSGAGGSGTNGGRRAGTSGRRRTSSAQDPSRADVVVAASGNLALVSFPRVPGRMTMEEIDRRWPRLIETAARHPGIGLVLARSAEGPVAIGPAGTNQLARGHVEGEDPVAPYGEHAPDSLRRLAGFDNAGDLIVLGRFDAGPSGVVSFEELVGTHGGLGGWQAEPFIAYPPEWSIDPDRPLGAPALYRQLEAWMAQLGLREPAAG